MGRKYKNIDDLFKSELDGLGIKVPVDVKAGIDKSLGFSSRKYWLFGIPFSAVLIASVILIPDWSGNEIVQSDSSTNSQSSTVKTNSGPTESSNSENTVSSKMTSDETAVTNESEAIPPSPVSVESSNSIVKSNVQPKVSSLTPTKSTSGGSQTVVTYLPNKTDETNTTENKYDRSEEDLINYADDPPDAKSELIDYEKTDENSSAIDKNDRSEENIINDPESSDAKNESIYYKEEDKKEDVESANSTKENAEIESEKTPEIKSPDEIAENKSSNSTTSEEKKEVEKLEKKEEEKANSPPKLDTSDKKEEIDSAKETESGDEADVIEDGVKIEKPYEKKNHWFITAEGGTNFARSFYDANDIYEQDLYSASMSDKIGSEFSLTANYRINRGLVGTGLAYSSFTEKYEFTDEYWLQDSTVSLEIIYDSTSVPIDTIYTWTYDSTFVSKFNEAGLNKASYLTIPINLGMQINWKKFRFDILASIRYNILLNASGTHFNNNSFIAFSKQSNNVYRKGYFDMVFAGNIHYNLFKNFYLTASVRYKPVFGNTYKTSSISRRFHYTHVGLGLSIEL